MTSSQPIVLEIQNVQQFVLHTLKAHAPPSTLVVCSTKKEFLEALRQPPTMATRSMDGLDSWPHVPTLRLLSTSRTLTLAFCPDMTHLRAYLATYGASVANRSHETDTALRRKDVQPILAVLNPLGMHRPTSAFSAQGLNRTFAIAVEAACSTKSKLIIAEGPPPSVQDESITAYPHQAAVNPWDEELSILNVTTKRLGDLSVGRTVKARTVAQRWCIFEQLPQPDRY